jgi:hypothetical protein
MALQPPPPTNATEDDIINKTRVAFYLVRDTPKRFYLTS